MRVLAGDRLRLSAVPLRMTRPAEPSYVERQAVVVVSRLDPLLSRAACLTRSRSCQDTLCDGSSYGGAGSPVGRQPFPVLATPAVTSGECQHASFGTLRVSLPSLGRQDFTVSIGVLARFLGYFLFVPRCARLARLGVLSSPRHIARQALHIALTGARSALDDVDHSRPAALFARRNLTRRTLILHRAYSSVSRPRTAPTVAGVSCVNFTRSLRVGMAA